MEWKQRLLHFSVLLGKTAQHWKARGDQQQKTGSIPTKEDLNIAERATATYSSKFQVTAKFSCYQSLLGGWFKTVSLQQYKKVTVR